jgi:hypothetical protein
MAWGLCIKKCDKAKFVMSEGMFLVSVRITARFDFKAKREHRFGTWFHNQLNLVGEVI